MPFTTPVASVTQSLGSTGGTTAAIDTTGANFIVAAVGYVSGGAPSMSDSKGNTWTPLTASTSVDSFCRLFYAENATVGSGHTFTVGGGSVFAAISVDAWADARDSSVFDQQNTGADPSALATSVQPGSVTPSTDNQLVVTCMSNNNDSSNVSRSINSGFTISGQRGVVGGTSYPIAMAYLVQTSAVAVNPTWSWSSGNLANSTIATFKSSDGPRFILGTH